MNFLKERDVLELFSFIFGICIGSFLNVLILKLPKNESLMTARSHCPKCNHVIYWYHNIPLFSYLFLRAKCSYCGTKISFVYFLVEFLSGILTLALFLKLGLTQEFIFLALLSYILITLSFIDLKYKAVPDYLLLLVFVLFIKFSKSTYFIYLFVSILLSYRYKFPIQDGKSSIIYNKY